MLFILAVWALAASAQTASDLLVENGRIYTGASSHPLVNSLAVKDGRIVAAGGDLSKLAGPSTKRIDLNGATVVPGFIDSHGHMAGLGDLLASLDLRAAKSVDAIADQVKKAAGKHRAGEWIQGRAWDDANWGGTFPTHQAITEAAGANPVFLTRVDGHAGWANQKAMDLAGVTAQTPDPPGGRIVRDRQGRPTGIFVDRAQALIRSKIPPPDAREIRTRLERALKECARLGLTGVHDAGIGKVELEAYRSLRNEGRLPVRIYAMIGGAGPLWREYLAKGTEIDPMLTVRTIKLMSDGAMGSRGAAFWQAYSDDPGNTGLLILSREEIEQVDRDAVQKGFQVATHAIGDRANRTVLDAYAAALGGLNDRRFRIEHAQVVSLPDFALFARYRIIASLQSTHATSDMRWAEARLGPDRLAGAWATQRFLKSGARIANGSDFPVESPNPLWGFYAAITRQDHEGKPPGGFLPDQKLTREQALRSFTLDGAYAAFEEEQKGTLEPGKLADFAVLSADIMEIEPRQILRARVIKTVLGGKVVYPE